MLQTSLIRYAAYIIGLSLIIISLMCNHAWKTMPFSALKLINYMIKPTRESTNFGNFNSDAIFKPLWSGSTFESIPIDGWTNTEDLYHMVIFVLPQIYTNHDELGHCERSFWLLHFQIFHLFFIWAILQENRRSLLNARSGADIHDANFISQCFW